MGAIQTEIEGRAKDLHLLSDEDLNWLADKFRPVLEHCGIDARRYIQGNADVAEAYGKRAETRLSAAQWRTFNGMCSHQNVPDNDHWDAGGIDLAYMSARMTGPNRPTEHPEPLKETYHMATRDIFQHGPNLGLMAEVSLTMGVAGIRTQQAPNTRFVPEKPASLHSDADPQPFGAVEISGGVNADGRAEIVIWSKDGRCARKVAQNANTAARLDGTWRRWMED